MQVRNKQLAKRDTEKMVKEVWNDRLNDPAVAAGKAGPLVDFLGVHLQKKLGIASAVIEASSEGAVVGSEGRCGNFFLSLAVSGFLSFFTLAYSVCLREKRNHG
jgi:hypothetical protein